MSFWRSLNKGLNNVLSASGSIVGGLGIPVFSNVGNAVAGAVEAGRNQGLGNMHSTSFMPSEGVSVDLQYSNQQKANNDMLLYGGIALAAILLLKK